MTAPGADLEYRYFQDSVTGHIQPVPADKVEQYGYDRQAWYIEVERP